MTGAITGVACIIVAVVWKIYATRVASKVMEKKGEKKESATD
jgi:hypothetical protein